jgi:TRAP transporter TAXI family solute receptor
VNGGAVGRRPGARARLSREHLYIYGPAFLLSIVGFFIAFHFVTPAPPRRIVMATGSQDGAYYQFGLRYQKLLARQGITLDVRVTSGSVENVRLLKDSAADVAVAFVQGGVLAAEESEDLLSLGTLYFEPIWVFTRAETGGHDIGGLVGKRLAMGPEGSGTRALAELMLKANGITGPSITRVPITGLAARDALQHGTVDAAFFVASVQAPMLREVIRLPNVDVMTFARADAYTRQFPFLTKVVLPQGALDLARDIPPHDTVLLASAVNLVIRQDFHPALSDLLLMTAATVHAGPGLFEQPRQFPSPDHVDVPLSPEAARYYASGPPFLIRYLPFWVGTWVDRLKVMLVPLLALMLPLFRVVPPLYRWRVRSRIYCWYQHLDAIDHGIAADATPAALAEALHGLERVENEVRRVIVPPSYREELYHLRLHIEFLRARVQAMSQNGPVRAAVSSVSPPPSSSAPPLAPSAGP